MTNTNTNIHSGLFLRLPLAGLLLAVLMLSGPDTLGAASAPKDLPCELTIPHGTAVSDYYDTYGDGVEADDECGLEAPADDDPAEDGDTSVSFELSFTPHQLSYDLFINTEQISKTTAGSIVILEMAREDRGISYPVLQLRLTNFGTRLELVATTDQDSAALAPVQIDPKGTNLTVELTKSTGTDTIDGRVRLLVDGQIVGEASALALWNNLPTAVRMGVVAVESLQPLGTLRFQPGSFRHDFFAYSL